MRLIIGFLRFFRLPLQIIIGAYASFVMIAMTIAWHENQKETEETVIVNETCRDIIESRILS